MNWKELVRPEDLAKLLANWTEQQKVKGSSNERDFEPVVKLFNPIGIGTWLITECDPNGLAFGLCDLGYPELGYVDLQEVADVRLCKGLVRIEQDEAFVAVQTISAYAEEARSLGYIRC